MTQIVPTFLIDPLSLFREGLRRILSDTEFQVVWCSDLPPGGMIDGLAASATPLVILGTHLREAMAQIYAIRSQYCAARIALLVDSICAQDAPSALGSGVDTIILRTCSPNTFIGSLSLLVEGVTALPLLMSSLLTEAAGIPEPAGDAAASNVATGNPTTCNDLATHNDLLPRWLLQQHHSLSSRELGVVKELQRGQSNKEIALSLGIREATVKVHVKAILRKIRVKNRTQAAMWANSQGLDMPHEITRQQATDIDPANAMETFEALKLGARRYQLKRSPD